MKMLDRNILFTEWNYLAFIDIFIPENQMHLARQSITSVHSAGTSLPIAPSLCQ